MMANPPPGAQKYIEEMAKVRSFWVEGSQIWDTLLKIDPRYNVDIVDLGLAIPLDILDPALLGKILADDGYIVSEGHVIGCALLREGKYRGEQILADADPDTRVFVNPETGDIFTDAED
jgi:hypothetical protein